MTEAWISACHNTIQKFVADSTRLQPNQWVVALDRFIDFDYRINLSLRFDVEREHEELSGRVNADGEDAVHVERMAYERALKVETSAVLARNETLRDAQKIFLARPYGEIQNAVVVYQHPRKICLTERCHECSGDGRVNCRVCIGSGEQECHYCFGSGKVKQEHVAYDASSTQNSYEQSRKDCDRCNARGKVRCIDCNGNGRVNCLSCDGEGELSEISSFKTVARPYYQLIFYRDDDPEFILDGLHKVGVVNLSQLGAVQVGENNIDYINRTVSITYNANIPFAQFESTSPQCADTPINWVLYGTTPQILDAGHVLEVLLRRDLDALTQQATPMKLLNPRVASRSHEAVRTFMESEAHQEMLKENRQGKKREVLREALHRAFPTVYLDKALGNLTKILRAIQYWSVVKWTLLTTLIIYFVLPFRTLVGKGTGFDTDPQRVYLTIPSRYDNQEFLLTSLLYICLYYGLIVLFSALGGALLSYVWRRSWLRIRLGKPLSKWGVETGAVRSYWLLTTVLICISTMTMLMLAPVWMTHDHQLFGVLPVGELVRWIVSK
ncbi:zinc finger-like domain-containing protein [Rouxiella sp. Mn2063]|uniref:zinc finger-like domain-containing protein n=1 Tax=Rouxiella sp. Mn2063 TaxID=3395262 RepID=UPI003BDDEE61